MKSNKIIKRKRSDTLIGTIEKQYGVSFGVNKNMKLGSYLKKSGFSSMSKALDNIEKRIK